MLKFTKVKGQDIYRSGDYEVTVRDLDTPLYGTSSMPRRLHEAVVTYRGREIPRFRARGSRARALGDAQALAGHHAMPQSECPSIGCTSHHDTITRKTFEELAVGDAIIDIQGKRHTITEIGDWEVFDDVWDEEHGDVVSARGRRLYTDTYPKGGIVDGQAYTEADMTTTLFRVEGRS